MFSHGFPYTNFHDLNLDWIIKTIKILFNKSVFSINNVEPDEDGNVTITGAELGAVATINNIAPVDGNVTLTASDVGAVAQGVGVTKVNGFSPDSSGNVLSGTVRSINGISPTSLPTPGNVVLTASDVGAPTLSETVRSVNGTTPDAQGNVNLPTVAGVTSVNGIGPDAQGNVDALPIFSMYDVISTLNSLADVIAYARSNPKKIFQTTSTNFRDGINPDPFAPTGTNVSDVCVYTLYCLGPSGETMLYCWNMTQKRYHLAINTIPVNDVLNPSWVELYNGTAETLSNIATAQTGIVIDTSHAVKFNNVVYARVNGHAETAHTEGNAPLFTISPAPAFQNWALLRKSDGTCIMVNILTSGLVEQMWSGNLAQGDYFTLLYNYPII